MINSSDSPLIVSRRERFAAALYGVMRAVHRSIDWSRVKPLTYWERMPAAFRAQSNRALSWGDFVQGLRRALQISQFSLASSEALMGAERLVHQDEFREFVRFVRLETDYTAVQLRVAIAEDKASKTDE